MTLCAVLLGFTACNDDNDALTDSTLTTYPHFTILGDEFTEVNLGDEYVDAGCTATLDGVDITSQIITTGSSTSSQPLVALRPSAQASSSGRRKMNS